MIVFSVTFLQSSHIKQIQNESKNVMQIDFTRGDEPYKYKLGGVEMQLHNYIIKDGKIEL